jgi:hypothetical protein
LLKIALHRPDDRFAADGDLRPAGLRPAEGILEMQSERTGETLRNKPNAA